jgi:hypothetical protein
MADYEEKPYFWVVICKNSWFHRKKNLLFGHTIPLIETDFFSPPPALKEPFVVRCDECKREYSYYPEELLRAEMEPPSAVAPHPLFQ